MESYENAQKIMQQRMLKNIAFFGRNKIVKSLQTALNGGNRKFNLYFDRNEINIIDLRNRRFLYPKGAFVSVAQNIAQTPLNNDKWKIYANNLRLSKLQKNSAGGYGVANLNITAEAINKIVDIVGNLSLGLQSTAPSLRGESMDLPEQSTSDSSLRGVANAEAIQKNNTTESRPIRGAKNREQGRSSASADFLLEKDLRGSPPKSEKAAAFWRVGGAGRGVQPFLRKEKGDKELKDSKADLSAESCKEMDCFGQSPRNDESTHDSPKLPQDEFAYHLPPLFLPQTNIFGLCGGLFLDILVENGYFFHSLLIYEEEAELFALSCYFVDYERLFSRTSPKSCYIFIENLLDKGLLNHYFYSKKITNNFLRLELSLLQSPKTRDFRALTFETYRANARGWGSFEDEMRGLKNTFANAKNAPFLRIDSKLKTPICVVGSGPSLESNMDFIRANQDKMLIFSCGTALKVLKKHNIHIDFQIEIERVPYLAEVLQSSNLGDTAVLCASLVDSKVLKVAKSATLFMRGGSAASYIFDDSASSYIFGDTTQEIAPLEFCAPFVGNAGFSLACALSDEVIMCGMDCGFVKGFAKHAGGSIYGDESAEIPSDCFKVEGNCSDFEVYSNAIFSLSKESFALSIAHYKPKIVHNLSFGAKIKGANFTQSLSLKNRAKKTPLNSRIVEKTAIDNAKQSLKNSALKFIYELKNALNCDISKPISTKQELFCYIDLLSDFLAKISEKSPKIGILFEGSISHLLQSAMIAMLCIKSNDIKEPFSACKAVILGACEAYKREIGDL